MVTRWDDIDRSFAVMDELRRRMAGLFGDVDAGFGGAAFEPALWAPFSVTWPRINLHDGGADFTVFAEVPGMTEKDVRISVNQDVLTVEGERRVQPPEGYTVHRQERPSLQFARSFTLPAEVQADKAEATIRSGMLHITLPKVPEAQPRQITVRPAGAGPEKALEKGQGKKEEGGGKRS